MIRRCASRLLALTVCLLAGCQQSGTEVGNTAPDSPTVSKTALISSEFDVVRAMLNLAGAGPDDLVVDLGSGDGRIPIMAAREKGSRGLGVEIDRDRILQSRKNAEQAGVADRVQFIREDLFVTPLNDVTVLTLFLLPEINLQLRPKILTQMRPGTRVVSNTWEMGDWRPDLTQSVGGTNIHLWMVPAQVAGRWRLTMGSQTTELQLDQSYQNLSGTAGGQPITGGRLRGDRISFGVSQGGGEQRLDGRVQGDRMTGNGWSAVRVG